MNSTTEGEEFNAFPSVTGPLSIPSLEQEQEQQGQNNAAAASPQTCISSSIPDREPPGHAFHHGHAHMYSSCGLSVCGGGASEAHKRTSIVSSAGLIAAELTPPHRPLRRSLGELPWSAHALLLTHFEDTTPHLQPPPPPPRANRMIVLPPAAVTSQGAKTSSSSTEAGGSSNGPKASSS